MRLDPNPLFRKIIIPWYDSPPVCWALLSAMVVLVVFSITGILVAEYNTEYKGFVWVPVVLLLLSLYLLLSLSVRMVRRANQQKEE
jgi:uncharacterized membrane protein YfcA